eukprot:3120449-Pyramimonas_sp.AAC.1
MSKEKENDDLIQATCFEATALSNRLRVTYLDASSNRTNGRMALQTSPRVFYVTANKVPTDNASTETPTQTTADPGQTPPPRSTTQRATLPLHKEFQCRKLEPVTSGKQIQPNKLYTRTKLSRVQHIMRPHHRNQRGATTPACTNCEITLCKEVPIQHAVMINNLSMSSASQGEQ